MTQSDDRQKSTPQSAPQSAPPMNLRRQWDALSKKVFWDRTVPVDKWLKGVAAAHRSYLPDSILVMTPAQFIRFYGIQAFKRDWPRLRASLPESALGCAPRFDLAWSQAVGGGWNLAPTPDFYSLPEKRRMFLATVARTPGKSIYEIAKNIGLQYRRAHDHAVRLVGDGKIRSVDTVENGRRKKILYPAYQKPVTV